MGVHYSDNVQVVKYYKLQSFIRTFTTYYIALGMEYEYPFCNITFVIIGLP